MTVQDLTVFPEAVVLDVEQTVFDAPMPPHQIQGFPRRQLPSAGYRILDADHRLLVALNDPLLDHYHAGEAGQIAIAFQFSGYPDLTMLQASMPFVAHLPIRLATVGEEQGHVFVELGLVFFSLKV